MTRWKNVHSGLPSTCLATSNAAVLSLPKVPNVSKRLAGYLPLASTCPSLLNVKQNATVHRLSTCGTPMKYCSDVITESSSLCAELMPQMYQSAPQNSSTATKADDIVSDDANCHDLTYKGQFARETINSWRNSTEHTKLQSQSAHVVLPANSTMLNASPRCPAGRQQRDRFPPQAGRTSMFSFEKWIYDHDGRESQIRGHASSPTKSIVTSNTETEAGIKSTNGTKNVEAAVAQLEVTQKKISQNPVISQLKSTIGLFESFSSGRKSPAPNQFRPQLTKRLPESASWQSKQLHAVNTRMTPTRRKLSSSWGPSHWRKALKAREEHTSSGLIGGIETASQACEQQMIPTDGSTDDLLPKIGIKSHNVQARRASVGIHSNHRQQEEDFNSTVQGGDGRRSWRLSKRRWISRSSGPVVARAECPLYQPQPVRASEVKRLVSICKDKVVGRKRRPDTD